MPDDAHVLDLLPALAAGSLDLDEVARVEDHLASCLICRQESAVYQNVATHLAHAVPLVEPSPDLKDRLMDRVKATQSQPRPTEKLPSPSWLERLLPAWRVASLLLIIALAVINLLLWQRSNQMDFFTTSGGLRAAPLSPSDAAPSATGFVLVSADGEDGALVVDGLPPLRKSQQYQLWLLRNGEKDSGAVFSTDEHSYGGTRIRVPHSLLEYSTAEITIEPEGGSPRPTGVEVLGGSLQQR